jgi:hypothetical protein
VDLAERDDPEGQECIEANGPGTAAIHLRPWQILSLLVEATG